MLVCLLFAQSHFIRQSRIPARRAAEQILSILQRRQRLFCQLHELGNKSKVDRIIFNNFFSNQRKRVTDSDVKERLVAF